MASGVLVFQNRQMIRKIAFSAKSTYIILYNLYRWARRCHSHDEPLSDQDDIKVATYNVIMIHPTNNLSL